MNSAAGSRVSRRDSGEGRLNGMNMMKLHPIFKDACRREAYSHDMSKPFGWCGMAYATDGIIAVRANVDIASRPHAPRADGLPWSPSLFGARHLLPVLPQNVFTECHCCMGLMHHLNDICEACDGTGSFEGDTCPDCNGRRCMASTADVEARCDECIGVGRTCDRGAAILVDRSQVSVLYIALLKKHGVTHLQPYAGKAFSEPRFGPLRFEGEGFEGLVMPMQGGDVVRRAAGEFGEG